MAETEEQNKAIENPEDPFGFGKKKKKKKVKDIDAELEAVEAAQQEKTAEPTDELQKLDINKQQDTLHGEEEVDFTGMKKKKKVVFLEDQAESVEFTSGLVTKQDQQILSASDTQGGWQGSERDYTYDELLERVFNIMREKNPDMITGEKKRFIMKPPQVGRLGSKKTSFSNFADICRLLRRQEKHLLIFLLAELGTSGSLDSNNQLTIKGRFSQRHIENVLRKYIKDYVICPTCRSSDTILVKEERIYFLQCESCKSRSAVASIKSGFQAQVVKRAAQRARAT